MNSSDSMLLNPYTPMSYLTPSAAKIYTLTANINLFTMGALAWDWAMSMPDEYRIISIGKRLSLSKITYFSSRVFTVTTCLCACILYVLPVRDCHALSKIFTAFLQLTLNSNNLLFFFRIRAVYSNSLRVSLFFGFCYIVVFITSVLVPSTLNAIHIGPTEYCVESEIRPWIASLATICNVVNDTLVFLAISYRIAAVSIGAGGRRSALQRFFCGDGAPRVIKQLLQNGQLYYLATIVTSIAHIILGLTTGYGTALTIPVVVVQHVMTCRVHRAVILGLANSNQPANTPLLLTTFISSVDASTMDDRFDAQKRWELQEGPIASP
ncbi:hypothetical protein FIBSPDRAFT_1038869 [Athelia psychrophila]|uniref:Uncharacterized protein n=1 Tax=Athelia psychrophila TaxID=1759441 RepID=A0A166SKI1_9AGAM|nr:hypothetical protein FIBSPDRAFT_1038869 [Fibularhizoctonia sp. CBS 109695]